MPLPRSYDCFRCGRRTKPKDRYNISKEHRSVIYKISGKMPGDGDYICNKCRHICRAYLKRKEVRKGKMQESNGQPRPQLPAPMTASPPSVTLPFPSTLRGHAYCCICKRPGPKLLVVRVTVRHAIFISKEVIIPAGSRCCPNHLLDNIQDLTPVGDSTMLSRTAITQLIRYLREEVVRQESNRLDFNNTDSLNNTDYTNFMGISKEAFIDMTKCIEGKVRCTPSRTLRTSLAIFLLKLRGGESNRVLSTLFNVSKSSVRRCIQSVRSALVSGAFVHENLGSQHITRETVIAHHTRQIAQTLFSDLTNQQVILVLDGTYIYIKKSGNFRFQRQSFSFHKGRPLVKPMVIVSTTGYFISAMGPYLAKNNDASILNYIMRTNMEDIRNWVQEEDIFIVDREFRDSLQYLEQLGIKAEMSSFFRKGESQLSTESANTSRLVTKIRWVVESANSRIKQLKYLNRVLPSSQIPYIGDFIRIVCAMCNKYSKSLSKAPSDEDQVLGSKMLYLSKQVNALKEYVNENHLDRRSACWMPTDDLKDFPILDENQLRSLTCGSYQLRLSPSYAQEYLEGDCSIQVHGEEPGLLRVRLQSRHVSSKIYQLWIRYDVASVISWYFKCRSGARVVGMCSHISSIVWYLGHPRHMYRDEQIGIRHWNAYVEDAERHPIPIDE